MTDVEEGSELERKRSGCTFPLIELDFTTKSFVSLNTWKDGIMHPKQDMKKSCLTVSMPTAIMEKKKL